MQKVMYYVSKYTYLSSQRHNTKQFEKLGNLCFVSLLYPQALDIFSSFSLAILYILIFLQVTNLSEL